MPVFILRRLLQSVLVLAVMSLLVFAGIHAVGNPIDVLISPDANQAERARIIAAFGLDQPLWKQYLLFISNALHGDLGRSYVFATPALALIAERLPSTGRGATVEVLGVPLSFLTLDGLKHLLLPALNLALFNIALVIRLTRAGTQEALLQDYVRFARAKGLSNRRIVGVHVLKNILIPILTVVALQFGSLVAFAIVTESIFAWPGMGKLIIDSMRVLDRPVIVAYLMLVLALFVLLNLVVDILYSLLDPRVRLSGGRA